MYAAKAQLDDEQPANQVKDVLGSKNLMGPAKDALQLNGDMDALVRLNACDGAGLRRFQENVVLFSKGKQPLLLPGAPPPVTPSALPPGVLADSDYNRLVEDLVADQARTWVFNRYVPGSTSRVIVAHDPTGRPSKILAKYLFNSPGKVRSHPGIRDREFLRRNARVHIFFRCAQRVSDAEPQDRSRDIRVVVIETRVPRLPTHLQRRLHRSSLLPIAAPRRNLLQPQLAARSIRPRWPLPQPPPQRPLRRLPLSNNNSSSAPRNARGGLRRLPIAVSKRSKITHKAALRWPKNILPASKPNSDPCSGVATVIPNAPC